MNNPGHVIRPSRLDDFDALMELAELSGPGFTSLPVNEALMRERLQKSDKAFRGELDQPQSGKFLMMLEELGTGEVLGCCAVKAGVGVDQPFFNYRIITLAQASQAGDRRFDMDALILTNEFVDYTEVGTLFLKPEARGAGVGRLTGQSRYLLMAAAPEQFSSQVLAELRGVVDEDGGTPFWEAVGRHFFRMSFPEADFLSAVSDNQFILDLMPKYPIYVDLLPPEAREVIGRCHADGVGALKLLEWEGFRFERVVDIFDGGPLVKCEQQNIRTVRESRLVTLQAGEIEGDAGFALISTDRLPNFRVVSVRADIGESTAYADASVFDVLQIKPGDTVRIWAKEPA
ncbi:MAG: arginine N-succinyltransferase [Pseudomonadota bacterium]